MKFTRRRAGLITLLFAAVGLAALDRFGWFAGLSDPFLTATHPGGACAFHPTYDSEACTFSMGGELAEANELARVVRAEHLPAKEAGARLVALLEQVGAGRRGLISAAMVYAANGQPEEATRLLERADAIAPVKGAAIPAEIATNAGRCDLARRFALRDLADPLSCYSSRITCAALTACDGTGSEVRAVLATPEPVSPRSIEEAARNLEVRAWLLDGEVAKAREAAAKLTAPSRLRSLEAAVLAASTGDDAALRTALDGLVVGYPCLGEALQHDRLGAVLLRNPEAARRIKEACPERLPGFEALLERAKQ